MMFWYPRPRFELVFFDRSVIRTNWKKINDRPLRRAGATVRKIARESIRHEKDRNLYSSPGMPPYSHAPGKPFKMIYNLPDWSKTREFVGMIGFGSRSQAIPGLHEHGGFGRTLVFPQRRIYKRGKRTPRRPTIRKTVRYPKRPFMLPALERTRHVLPEFWRNSISRAGY